MQQVKNWSMVGYRCYQKPHATVTLPRTVQVVPEAEASRAPSVETMPQGAATSQASSAPVTSPAEQSVERPPLDLASIQSYISKINDTCDQVDEVLVITNATMYKMMDKLDPAVGGAMGLLEKAKIAAEAADLFGVTGMSSFVTQFVDKISVKVVDFQSKINDASVDMMMVLSEVHTKFSAIKVDIVDKFGDAFEQVVGIVQVVIDIVKATKMAVAAAGGSEGMLLRSMRTKTLLQEAASISRGDLAEAEGLITKGSVSASTVSTFKFGLNAQTLAKAKSAISTAKKALEPLAAALVDLYDKISNGMMGQMLDSVENGVSELNETACKAVEAATSSLPGIIKNQLQGLFGGVLNVVGQVSDEIGGALEQISDKLDEANNTQASLMQAADMMSDLIDGISPMFTGSVADESTSASESDESGWLLRPLRSFARAVFHMSM